MGQLSVRSKDLKASLGTAQLPAGVDPASKAAKDFFDELAALRKSQAEIVGVLVPLLTGNPVAACGVTCQVAYEATVV